MNLEKLKKAEIVYGEKLDHPDDTYGLCLAPYIVQSPDRRGL